MGHQGSLIGKLDPFAASDVSPANRDPDPERGQAAPNDPEGAHARRAVLDATAEIP